MTQIFSKALASILQAAKGVIAPKLMSLGLHVAVVLLLFTTTLGDEDVPELPPVQAVEILFEPGQLDAAEARGESASLSDSLTQPIEDFLDNDLEQTHEVQADSADEPELPVLETSDQEPTSPGLDDLQQVFEVAEDLRGIPEDLIVDDPDADPNRVQEQASPETGSLEQDKVQPKSLPLSPKVPDWAEVAPTLALAPQDDPFHAAFNPDGDAMLEDRSAEQVKAQKGASQVVDQPSEQVTTTPATDRAADQESQAEVDVPSDQVLSLADEGSSSDDTAIITSLSDTQSAEAPANPISLPGSQIKEIQDAPKQQEAGDDDKNVADSVDDPDAKKVTTPIPRPKPRALAVAAKQKRERAEKAEAEAKTKAEREKAAEIAAKKQQAQEEKAQKQAVKDREAEEARQQAALDAALTAELNESMAQLAVEASSSLNAQAQQQEAQATSLSQQGTSSQTQGASAKTPFDAALEEISSSISGGFYAPQGLDTSYISSVTLIVEFDRDASIVDMKPSNQARYESDSTYHLLVERAKAATRTSDRLTHLLSLPYEQWSVSPIVVDLSNLSGN